MALPDPPGKTGLPLIGETLEFLKDGYGFTERRVQKYGPIFQTSLLGKKTVIIAGPQACMRWVDDSLIQRADSMPDLVLKMFGGVSLPLLDGPAHQTRKFLIRSAFTPEQLPGYLPDLQALVEDFFQKAAVQDGPMAAVPALKELAITCICKNVMGLEAGPEVDALVADYQILLAAPSGVPVNVPGTSLHRAIAARERIFAILDRLVAERRSAPGTDGLSTILQSTAPDGSQVDDVACRLELHHVVLAGYIIFGEFVASMIQLAQHPEVRDRLRAEIQERAPQGPLGPTQLAELTYLEQVVRELKRHTPLINTFFGIAREEFELMGHRIPKGRSVMLSITGCNMSKESFDKPQDFDPERFGAERAEHTRHPHAYVPQGPGDMERSHRCLGYEYTTMFMSVFLVHLLRSYTWTVPEQDLGYDWSCIPAEPKSGLQVQLTRA